MHIQSENTFNNVTELYRKVVGRDSTEKKLRDFDTYGKYSNCYMPTLFLKYV